MRASTSTSSTELDAAPRVSLRALELALLALAAVAFLLSLLDRPPAAVWPVSPATVLRAAVALPVVLLVPGLGLAVRLFRAELAGARGELDGVWALAAGLALAVPLAVAQLVVLRLVGLAITGPLLAGILVAEAALFVALDRASTMQVQLPSRAVGLAFALGVVPIGLGVLAYSGPMGLDSTFQLDFVEVDAALEPWVDGEDDGVLIERAWAPEQRFSPPGRTLDLTLSNPSDASRTAHVFMLVHGPRGSSLDLTVDGAATAAFARTPQNQAWVNAPQGVLVAHARVPMEPGARRVARLTLEGPEGAYTAHDFSGASRARILRLLSNEGVYSGSLGTIVEFDALARELERPRGDPVWAVFGRDFGIPPGFVHLATALRAVGPAHTVTFSALVVLGLVFSLLLALRAIEEGAPALDPWLGVPLGLVMLQHLHAVHDAVQWNFADNWYTAALLASVLALATRKPRLFAAWAIAALITRYPGAVVAGLAGLALFAFDRPQRASTRASLAWLVAVLVALFAFVFLVGTLSGEFEDWVRAANHEVYGEHFEQNPHVPLLERASEFLAKWGAYGGLGLLFALPLVGVPARVLLAAVAVYAPMLVFIDHFANHYILPLMAMGGVAAAANLAGWSAPRNRRIAIVLWAVLLAALAHPTLWGHVWAALLFHQ